MILKRRKSRSGHGGLYRKSQDYKRRATSFYDIEFNTFDQKKAYEAIGKGNGGSTDEWENTLSDLEKESIQLYTSYHYEDINRQLRKENVKEKYTVVIDSLDKSIDRFELNNNIEFHRGDDGGLIGYHSVSEINSLIGNEITNKGFTSTSIGKPSSEHYIYFINTKKGKGIGAYIEKDSLYHSEKEFLYARNSKFRINGAREISNKTGGKIYVYLEYLGK